MSVVHQEDRLRNGVGMRKNYIIDPSDGARSSVTSEKSGQKVGNGSSALQSEWELRGRRQLIGIEIIVDSLVQKKFPSTTIRVITMSAQDA